MKSQEIKINFEISKKEIFKAALLRLQTETRSKEKDLKEKGALLLIPVQNLFDNLTLVQFCSLL